MPASRGFVSRAASALLFAGAAALVLAFPGTAAENDAALLSAPFGEGVRVESVVGAAPVIVAQAQAGGEFSGFGGGLADTHVEGDLGAEHNLVAGIPETGDLQGNRAECEALLGRFNSAGSGFCLDVGTSACRIGRVCAGLFEQVRQCHLEENKKGATNRVCGAACDYGLTAVGTKCAFELGGVIQPNRETGLLPPEIPETGDLQGNRAECEALLGRFNSAGSGFCLDVGTSACRIGRVCAGLFEQVRQCHLEENKKGATNRVCGAACPYGAVARGTKCVAPPRVTPPPPPDPCEPNCKSFQVDFIERPDGGTLSAEADGAAVSPGATLKENTQITFTASPAPGRYVREWTNCLGQTGRPGGSGDRSRTCVTYVTLDLDVGVTFGRDQVRVEYNPNPQNGVISAELPDGAPVAPNTNWDAGTEIIFTATPVNQDHYLQAWTGACSPNENPDANSQAGGPGDNVAKTCRIALRDCDEPGCGGNVGAIFEPERDVIVNPPAPPPNTDDLVLVTVDPETGMTITLNPGDTLPEGRTIVIVVTPGAGYCVDSWLGPCAGVGETGCVGEASETKECRLPVTPGLEMDLPSAVPVVVPQPPLQAVIFSSRGPGTLSAGSSEAVPVGGSFASGGKVRRGYLVSFVAEPAPGHYLSAWEGDCLGNSIGNENETGPVEGREDCQVSATRDLNVVAVFRAAPKEPFTPAEIAAALPEADYALNPATGRYETTRGAVLNYFGAVLTAAASAGSALSFSPGQSGGLEIDADGEVRTTAPVAGRLSGIFQGTLSRADREPMAVAVEAVVSPVFAPASPDAIVVRDGVFPAGTEMPRPAGYASGGSFRALNFNSIFSVNPATGAVGSAGGAPATDAYDLRVGFTHPGFAGEVVIPVEVRVVGPLSGIPDSQLNPGRFYLASDYSGGNNVFHTLEPDGSQVQIRTTPGNNGTFGSGGAGENQVFRVAVSDNRAEVSRARAASGVQRYSGVLEITETNASGDELRRTQARMEVQLIGRESGGSALVNAFLTVTVGTPEAQGVLAIIELPATPYYPAFRNLEVVFSDVDSRLELNGTELRAKNPLEAGIHKLTMSVRSPSKAFLGDVWLAMDVVAANQPPGPLRLADAIADSRPVVYAASDYTGDGLTVSLAENVRFVSRASNQSGAGFAVDGGNAGSDSFVSRIVRGIGTRDEPARVAMRLRCVEPKVCNNTPFNAEINIIYRPLPGLAQAVGYLPFGDSLSRVFIAPSGFEGGRFEELTADYENPAHAALFVVEADGSVEQASAATPLAVGTYKIPVSYAAKAGAAAVEGGGGFLGKVRLTMTVEVVPQPLGVGEGVDAGLLRPPLIAVSPSYADQIFRAPLRGANVGLQPSSGVAGRFRWRQDGRDAVIEIDAPPDGGETITGRVTLTEVFSASPDNYEKRRREVRLTVRGVTVAAPPLGGAGTDTAQPYSDPSVTDLKRIDGAYAAAGVSFEEFGNSDGLAVSPDGIVSTERPLDAGDYSITADAQSAGGASFLGVARITASLNVQDNPAVEDERGIPPDRRSVERNAAAGYASSVAFFAAADSAVALAPPNPSPPGFEALAAPGGILVNVQLVQPGARLEGLLTVTATAPGRSATPIPLVVKITAVDPQAQQTRTVFYAAPDPNIVDLPDPARALGGNFVLRQADLGLDGGVGPAPAADSDFAVGPRGLVSYAPTAPLADSDPYRLLVDYSQNDMLGRVAFSIPMIIARSRLAPADRVAAADLDANVLASPTYAGPIHTFSPQNVARVDLRAPDSSDPANTLRDSTNFQLPTRGVNADTAEFYLPVPLQPEGYFETSAEFRELGGRNYENELITVAVALSILAVPDEALLGELPRDQVLANMDLHDFGQGFYDSTEITFAAGTRTHQDLVVESDGRVLVGANNLGGGFHSAEVEASSPTGAFLGTVVFDLQFTVPKEAKPAGLGADPADLIPDAVTVAPLYADEIYRISPQDEDAVNFQVLEVSDGRLRADEEGGGNTVVIALRNGLGSSQNLNAEVVLEEDAGPNYLVEKATVEIQVESLANPPDERLEFGAADSEVAAGANLHNFAIGDFATGVDFAESTDAPSAELEVSGGGQAAVGAAALPVGIHDLLAEGSSTDDSFLGALPFRLRVVVTASPLPAGQGIPDNQKAVNSVPQVAIAPGHAGVVRSFALAGPNVNLDLSGGNPTENGVRASQSGRNVELAVVAGSGLASQETRRVFFDLTEEIDARYQQRQTRVGVELRATDTGKVNRVLGGLPTQPANVNVVDLSGKDSAYAGATFTEATPSSSDLKVDASGQVQTQRQLAVGTYSFRVEVENSGVFLGKAVIEVELVISGDPVVDPATEGVAESARLVQHFVVPGYTGSVAAFAAKASDFELRTPSTVPSGLVFLPNRNYRSPTELVVNLAPGISAGETRIQSFNVTARRFTGSPARTPTPFDVVVSVMALEPPAQPEHTVDTGDALPGGVAFVPHPDFSGGTFTLLAVEQDGVEYSHPFAELGASDGALALRPESPTFSSFDSGKLEVVGGYSHPGFLGILRMRLTVEVFETPAPGEVVLNRDIDVYAGPGYGDFVYQAAADRPSEYAVSRTETAHPPGFFFDNDNLRLALDGALGNDARTAEVTLTAECKGARRTRCRATEVPLEIRVNPVLDPGQEVLNVITGDESFERNLVLPPRGAALPRLDVESVSSPEPSVLPGHFSIPSGSSRVKYSRIGGIPRGTHRVRIRFRDGHPTARRFFGDAFLELEIRAEDLPRLPSATLNAALPPSSRNVPVQAAEGYVGEVHRVTSHVPQVSLVIAPFSSNGLLIDEDGIVSIPAATPLAGFVQGNFPVRARQEGHSERVQNVAVNVFQVPAIQVSVAVTEGVDSDGVLAELEVPGYPAVEFSEAEPFPAGLLELSGSQISTPQPPPAGLPEGGYGVKVSGVEPSGEFLGTLAIDVTIDVATAPAPVADLDSIPLDLRAVRQTAAFGYTGSVAFFAAAADDVTLRVLSQPFGFRADAGDYGGANGFTVSVTLAADPGASRTGVIPLLAIRDGFRRTELNAQVEVESLGRPAEAVVNQFVGRLPDDGILHTFDVPGYPNAALELVSADSGLELSMSHVVVGPAGLTEGEYTMAVDASDAGFLGKQRLNFLLEAEGGTVVLSPERALGDQLNLTIFGVAGYQADPLVQIRARDGTYFTRGTNVNPNGGQYETTQNANSFTMTPRNEGYGFREIANPAEQFQYPRKAGANMNFRCNFTDGRVCRAWSGPGGRGSSEGNGNRGPQLDVIMTVSFDLVTPPAQPALTATVNSDPHVPLQGPPLNRPAGFEFGGSFVLRADPSGLFAADPGTGALSQANEAARLPEGRYEVTVGLSYPPDDPDGFRGELLIPVTIAGYVQRLPIPDADAIPESELRPGTVYVAEFYPNGGLAHQAGTRSQNLTVIIEEPLPVRGEDYSTDFGDLALGPNRATLSVPLHIQLGTGASPEATEPFLITVTLVAVGANGQWDQRYEKREEVIEFESRLLPVYAGNARMVEAYVQQDEPNASRGETPLTLSIPQAPDARFTIISQRNFMPGSGYRAGEDIFFLGLEGENPATVVFLEHLTRNSPQGGTETDYRMEVAASDLTGLGFRGTVMVDVQINVAKGRAVTLTQDKAVLPENRYATIFVARNHLGAFFTLTLESGARVIDSFPLHGFNLDFGLRNGRELEVASYAPIVRDQVVSGNIQLGCQREVDACYDENNVNNLSHRLNLDWGLHIQVVEDPGQSVIRATVFDPFVGEALRRPGNRHLGSVVFETGGNFHENELAYSTPQYFTVAVVDGTVSSEPINLENPDTIIPAGLYNVPVDFDHRRMFGTLRMTAPVNVVTPPARFYRHNYDVGETDLIPDAEHTLSGDARGTFIGTRRGLTVMFVAADTADDLLDNEIAAAEFNKIRAFCRAGGLGWRLPTFTEVAGILSDDNLAYRRLAAVQMPGFGGPEGDDGFNVTLQNPRAVLPLDVFIPAVPSNPAAGGFISDHIVNAGGNPVLAVGRSSQTFPGRAVFGGESAGLDLFCVRETDKNSYDQSKPIEPAGVLITGLLAGQNITVDETNTVQITVFLDIDIPAGADYRTITLQTWRYDDALNPVAAEDSAVSYSHQGAVIVTRLNDARQAPHRADLAVRPQEDGADINLTLFARPEVGREVEISVAFLIPKFTFNGHAAYLIGDRIPSGRVVGGQEVLLQYYGKRRGNFILFSASGGANDDGILPLDAAAEADLPLICDNSETEEDRKFHAPSAGELAGLLSDLPGPLPLTLETPTGADAPAGAHNGLTLEFGLPYDAATDADEMPDDYQWLSRNAAGQHGVVTVSAENVHLTDPADHPNGARVVCILPDTEDDTVAVALPLIRGVQLSGEARDRDNVTRDIRAYADAADPADAPPIITVQATLGREDPGGTRVLRGFIGQFRHKDAPEILAGEGPPELEVVGAAPDGFNYRLQTPVDADETILAIQADDPRIQRDLVGTLTVDAAPAFGQKRRFEIELVTRPTLLRLEATLVAHGGLAPRVTAALQHAGGVYIVDPVDGYVFSNPAAADPNVQVFDSGLGDGSFGLEIVAGALEEGTDFETEFSWTTACLESPLGSGEYRCEGSIRVEATLQIEPVSDPGQLVLQGQIGQLGGLPSQPLTRPVQYASGGNFAELDDEYATASHADFFTVNGDTGQVGVAAGQSPPAGAYIVPVGYFREADDPPALLGTVLLEQPLEVNSAGNILQFGGAEFAAVGGQQDRAFSPPFSGMARMTYLGIRRGLQLVEVAPAGSQDPFEAPLLAGNFAAFRDFCAASGFQWRMPTFLESLGAVYAGAEPPGGVEFTKLTPVHVPGYESPDLTRRYNFAGLRPENPGDTTAATNRNILADFVVVDPATDSPLLASWLRRNAAEPPDLNGGADNRRLVCARAAVQGYLPPTTTPAGLGANDRAVNAEGVLQAILLRPDNYQPEQSYGDVVVQSYRYADDGAQVAADAPFAVGTFGGEGVSIAQTEDAPSRKVYTFVPENSDEQNELLATVLLSPDLGDEVTLNVRLLRALILNPESVLPEVNPVVPVAHEYSGRGFEIVPNEFYRLFDFQPAPGVIFNEDDARIDIARGDISDPVVPYEAVVEFTAECVEGRCRGAERMGITVLFAPVSDPGQERVNTSPTDVRNIRASLAAPAGYEAGGTFAEVPADYDFPADAALWTVDPASGEVTGDPAGHNAVLSQVGGAENYRESYIIPVDFTHPGFRGEVRMLLPIELLPEGAVAPFGVVGEAAYFMDENPTLTIAAADHDLDIPAEATIRAEFIGLRRGLQIVEISDFGGEDLLALELAKPAGAGLANLRGFCAARRGGWRMPNFNEALGLADDIADDPPETAFVRDDDFRVPGFSRAAATEYDFALAATLEADFADPPDQNILADFVVVPQAGGDPTFAAWSENPVPGSAAEISGAGTGGAANFYCVREYAVGYRPPPQPSGFRINGQYPDENGVVQIEMTLARHNALPGGGETGAIQINSWRFSDAGSEINSPDVSFLDISLNSSDIQPSIAGPDGNNLPQLKINLQQSLPGRNSYAIIPSNPTPDADVGLTYEATLRAKAANGVVSTFPQSNRRGAEAMVELRLSIAFALSPVLALRARDSTALAAEGYSGVVASVVANENYALANPSIVGGGIGRIESASASEILLAADDVPAAGNPVQIRAALEVRCETAETCQSPGEAAEFVAEVIPVSAPDQTSRRAESDGGVFNSGPLLIPDELQNAENPAYTLDPAAPPSVATVFGVHPSAGNITTAAAPPAGEYEITVLFSAEPEMRGSLPLVVELESAPRGSIGNFGGAPIVINEPQQINVNQHQFVADEDLMAVARGTRRGLQIVQIQSESGRDFLQAELEQPDGAGFPAIREFCESRGAGWRMPTLQEAAGIAAASQNAARVEFIRPDNPNLPGRPDSNLKIPGLNDFRQNAVLRVETVAQNPNDDLFISPNVLADYVAVHNGQPRLVSFGHDNHSPDAGQTANDLPNFFRTTLDDDPAPVNFVLDRLPHNLGNLILALWNEVDLFQSQRHLGQAEADLGQSAYEVNGWEARGISRQQIAEAEAEFTPLVDEYARQRLVRASPFRVSAETLNRSLVCVRPADSLYVAGTAPVEILPDQTVTLVRSAAARVGDEYGTVAITPRRYGDNGAFVPAAAQIVVNIKQGIPAVSRLIRSVPGVSEIALRPASAQTPVPLRVEIVAAAPNSIPHEFAVVLAKPAEGGNPADECETVGACPAYSECVDPDLLALSGVQCGECLPGFTAGAGGVCESPDIIPVVPPGIPPGTVIAQTPETTQEKRDAARMCAELGGTFVEENGVPYCEGLETENPQNRADLSTHQGREMLDQARDCAAEGKLLAEDGTCETETCPDLFVLRGGFCQPETAGEPVPDFIAETGEVHLPLVGNSPEKSNLQWRTCIAFGGFPKVSAFGDTYDCVGLELDFPQKIVEFGNSVAVPILDYARNCALKHRRLASGSTCSDETCEIGEVLRNGRCVRADLDILDEFPAAAHPFEIPNAELVAACDGVGGKLVGPNCTEFRTDLPAEDAANSCNLTDCDGTSGPFTEYLFCSRLGRILATGEDNPCPDSEKCPPNSQVRSGLCREVGISVGDPQQGDGSGVARPTGDGSPRVALPPPAAVALCLAAGNLVRVSRPDGAFADLCLNLQPNPNGETICRIGNHPGIFTNPDQSFSDPDGNQFANLPTIPPCDENFHAQCDANPPGTTPPAFNSQNYPDIDSLPQGVIDFINRIRNPASFPRRDEAAFKRRFGPDYRTGIGIELFLAAFQGDSQPFTNFSGSFPTYAGLSPPSANGTATKEGVLRYLNAGYPLDNPDGFGATFTEAESDRIILEVRDEIVSAQNARRPGLSTTTKIT